MNRKSTNPNLIALYVPTMGGGGAERAMLRLACGIADKGHRVDLVLAVAKGPYLADVPANVRVVDLGAKRVLMSLLPLVQYLRRERPRGLIATMGHANLIAIWARLLSRVPTSVVASVHNAEIEAVSASVEVRAAIVGWFLQMFRAGSGVVVAVSEGVADSYARATGMARERIKVVYNAILTDAVIEQSNVPLLHPWMQPGQPPVVLSVGRLTDVKDHVTLLRAFAQVVHRGADARLIILGEGEKRPELEAWVRILGLERHRIILPGWVCNPYPYMRHAAVFVQASKSEGLPSVLIEALACGCPVVATDCPGGTREILDGGKLGRLVPVGDIEAMADAITDVLRERPAPAPAEALSRYRPEPAVEGYLALI